MDTSHEALRRYLDARRDEPFSASQAAEALAIDRKTAEHLLGQLVRGRSVSELPGGRFLFTTNADCLAYHLLLDIAPKITFDEYLAHREEPHVLVRMSRDREIAKVLRTEER